MVNMNGTFKVKGGSGGGISAPSTPSITNKTSSGFTASWDAVTGALGYRLDVATDSGFTSFVTGYNSKAVSGTSEVVTGLSQNTTYYVRVRAVAASSSSSASSETTSETTLLNPSLTSGLQAFYKLDDVNDDSGNGNDLTNNGGVTFSSGKIGNCAIFSNGNYIDGNLSGIVSDFSISGWIKADQMNSFTASFGINQYYDGVLFRIGPCSDQLYIFGSYITVGNFNADQWYHFTITGTNGDGKIYVDGSLANSLSYDPTYTFGATPLFTAGASRHNLSQSPLYGQIDAVGIWNRALTEPEIAELYNSGAGLE